MSFQEYAEQQPHETPRIRWGRMTAPMRVGAIGCAVACLAAILFFSGAFGGGGASFSVEKTEAAAEETSTADAPASSRDIHVHMTGCVVNPGMHTLPAGARLADAVSAAGGFTEDALEQSVNLARELADGEQVIVASKEAQAAAQAEEGVGGPSGGDAVTAADGRVNINTADAAQLQTISGIGPAKAGKIVAYREANGAFKAVEDLCKVSGIGEKTLASIRDQICVG